MRKLQLLLSLVLLHTAVIGQTSEELSTDFTYYSYTEFFKAIAQSTDSVFRLENAVVQFNEKTDQRFQSEENGSNTNPPDSIIVNVPIELRNVHFLTKGSKPNSSGLLTSGVLKYIHFKKNVSIRQCIMAQFEYCSFEEGITFTTWSEIEKPWIELGKPDAGVNVLKSKLIGSIYLTYYAVGIDRIGARMSLNANTIRGVATGNRDVYFFGRNIFNMNMAGNNFLGTATVTFNDIDNESRSIVGNNFNDNNFQLNLTGSRGFNSLYFVENTFNKNVELDIENYHPSYSIPFDQFTVPILSRDGLDNFLGSNVKWEDLWEGIPGRLMDSIRTVYAETGRTTNKLSYKHELTMLGMLNTHYKSKYDNEDANAVYIRLKDLETARFKYLYHESPSFDAFFTWKINQFLKLFSAYGTEPAKAIVFSVYVILTFALVYLFFPNHWDSHGKHRIMDRYRFFLKYLNRDSGIHEVYLEEQKQDLLNAEDFKTYLLEQGKTAPKFFMATAMPLYKWSVSGTKTFSWFLEKIDFLKGKWSETEPSKQGGKSVLLITAFLIALTYDIFIKMLNALMLSINTFTTLGFGEIPIKGLPRYLAIIQGFIGWFMLTIFSVSLISQLLN